ncbi:MAG: cytochrome c-type biogenesis protein CcmH, partial [Gammaproteobacteria bacterium]|nr:cytochrome c-type biogenesis protein CcmH [Gammaproteobacteria bacterium]
SEARYQRLINELRCPQCLNTNLAGSDAMIAKDLRREVHEQVLAGKTDEEILSFMQARYGDFVLYRPRLKLSTVLLWGGPVLVLLIGLVLIVRVVRSSGAKLEAQSEISDAESIRLQRLLESKGLRAEEKSEQTASPAGQSPSQEHTD